MTASRTSARASRSPTCPPATPSSCPSPWPGRRRSGPATSSSASTPSTTSGYPDCRPEYIAAYEQMANLATKAGVEGRQRLHIHTPLIDLTKAQIIERGLALGVDYGLTHSCYDPDADGRPCGTCDSCLLRQQGFAELGMEDPALVGSARADDLPGQGDLLHPARRGRPGRAAGGVLPVLPLQPVDRAREADRARAVCQFCDTDFVGTDGPGGGGSRRRGPGGGRQLRPGVGGRHEGASPTWCAPAANRCCNWTQAAVDALHAAGFEVAVETNGTQAAPPGLDWICVSPKAGAPLKLDQRRRTEARLPPGRGAARRRSRTWASSGCCCSRWTARSARRTPRLAVEYCLAHPQWRLSLQTHKYLGIA